jgi:hypothetical protein
LLSLSKIKIKGRHFDTTEVIEAGWQAVLNPTSTMHLKMAEELGTDRIGNGTCNNDFSSYVFLTAGKNYRAVA